MPSVDVWVNSKMVVKFPFKPYDCQKIFMKNVINVLDSKMDAALESPTGTGKTLSLLCSTLAWVQREKETKPMDFATWQETASSSSQPITAEKIKSSFVPTIYYASRTHSQLEQVVHELNRTDYKWVKTTILGSREHFCINPKVKKIQESNKQAHICRGMVSKRTCHYYNKYDTMSTDKMAELLDKGEAMDIEEIVKIGNVHSMCPYYMTRQRSETAELILLPYNYIIDPKMRRRYKLDLKNSIVIFDEAHNLESICEANASAEITSTDIALCIEELKKVLALLSEEEETVRAEADITTEGFGSSKIDLSKKLIENLRIEDLMTILEKIFKIEEEFENVWKGDQLKSIPNLDGKACNGEVLLKIFENAQLDGNSIERVIDVLRDATSYLLGKGEDVALTEKGDGMERMCDFILSVFSTHAQEVAAAVGDESIKLIDRIDPKMIAQNSSVSMRMLKMRGVRSVLLASGTLSPIQSFTFNMGLNFGSVLENDHALKSVPVITSVVMKGYKGGIMGSYANRSDPDYISNVAEVLIRVLGETPQGVIVFFASYSQMNDLVNLWKNSKRANTMETFWEKMQKLKTISVEPKAKNELAAIRAKYMQGVKEPKGSALFAVCRGKVSEGIDFCDAESRAVVIVGIPYPPINDERVVLKKMFLDDLIGRKEKKENELQSSKDWYQMEAFRAVNQAIGRVLRHKNDFGTVVLIDSRYATVKLEMFPKWLRKTITRGDINECSERLKRFFGERKHLVEESKIAYSTKIESTVMVKQKKNGNFESSSTSLTEISLDELFGKNMKEFLKNEKTDSKQTKIESLSTCSTSSSGFFLPTNEDEICRKNIEGEKTDSLKIAPIFRGIKRSANDNDVTIKNGQPAKKKIVLIQKNAHQTIKFSMKYEEILKKPTGQIIKELNEADKKQFVAALKAYKAENIGWKEVFDRFLKLFGEKNKNELLISCANLLRPDDKSNYLKYCFEKNL